MPRETKFSPIEDKILVAAISEFAKAGFHDVSLEDVARSADVSVEAITELFASKHGLLLPMLKRVRGDLGSLLIPHFGRESGPTELAALLNAFREGVVADPDRHRLEVMMMPQVIGRDRTFQPLVQAMYRAWRGLLQFFVQRAGNEGRLRPELDPGTVAIVLYGALIGLRFQWYLDPDAIDLERSFDTLIQIAERSLLDAEEESPGRDGV